jgi:AcrR family transcriptional regulator
LSAQDGRKTRAKRLREKREAEILVASQEVFGTKGYHQATVADIITAAEVSRGTFYLYFKSKAQVFHAVLDGFIQRLMDAINVVDASAADATAQMAQNIERVVDLFFDNRYLTIVLLREAVGLDDEVDASLAKMHAFMLDMVEGAFINGAQVGLIREINAQIAATALIGSFKEVLYQHLVSGADDTSPQVVASVLFDLYLNGLKPTGRQC